MINRLHVLLDSLGYELAAPELLDVLWLARVMGQESPTAEPPTVQQSIQPAMEPVRDAGPEAPAAPSEPAGDPRATTHAGEPAGRPHRLYAADGGGTPGGAGARARSVRAPGPRALPSTQPLARALRPLRGYHDHRFRTVADIEATVRLTAESGVLDVVNRPEQELRHTAVLLVDDSPSMRLWQPLAQEVKRLLEQAGVFRAVRVHRFALGRGHRPARIPRTESPVTFVFTDGVDETWQSPAADRFIETCGRGGPLTVLPPLPRRLWRGTAFNGQPHPVVAEQPFVPARELRVLDPLSGLPVGRTADQPSVPVTALTPSSLSAWVRLLTRPGTPSLVDIALFDSGGGASRASAPLSSMLPQHRLERFRASFSPDSYRLAMRLSAIRPLSLPVIQLVRIASLPGASPTAVAEILLGDLLRPLEDCGPEDLHLPTALGGRLADPLYDFRPGIRDLLASGLSVEQSIEVVEAVGAALEPYLGRMPDFAALLDDPGGNEHRSAGTSAFAVLVSPVLDRLYGRTTPVAEVHGALRAPVRFTVFGPHLAWQGSEPVPMGSPWQKAVLAALVLRRGRAVDDTALVASVWGARAPDGMVQVVRSDISRLRQVLASSGIRIDDTPDGYRLLAQGHRDVPDLDLAVAERLHEEAKTAQAAGDLAGARQALTHALAHTEGSPLDGIPGPFATSQAARLGEWRLALLEFRIELDLEAGDHATILHELERLAQAHPLNERLRAHLMLALYRSDREAEALAVYSDLRKRLNEEVGLDPGPELTRLQQRILRGAEPAPLAVASRPLTVLATSPAVDGLRFSVLGHVRAWRGDKLLSTGSPQQRALLTALLLREGRTATAGELIDAFWGEDPPSQALATIRTYASRLRKILGQDTLVSESGGYAIRTDRGALDLTLAQDLAAEAERARAEGDLPQARTLINKVLGLWDGEALASVPGPYAEKQRIRLEEWRLQLAEARLDLDLEVGSHAEAVSELTALTAAHPLRERLRELLMVALHRSGRQAEALAVYADTRRLLAEELGVDPRPELAQLQQRILRADEELARPADEPAPASTPLKPAQLPATVPDFTGRSAFVAELGSRLATAEGSVMAVSAVAGIGGVGKTTLAVHVAHQARRHFPDGQLYVDLQSTGGRAAAAETVLGSFLRALGTADSAIPDTLDERAALYRSTLDGRRVLILLDNAHDAAQIRPLLPGTPGCAALVTSRVRMVDLAGAHLVDLDVMSPDESLQLLTRIVGAERVSSEREAALDVVAACGFLPLAIGIAARRLAARRTWTVSVLAAKLADERRRLDELQVGDLAVKAAFELGYGQLEPAQARAFRLLGLADGPDISLAAAAALLNLDPHTAQDLLEALADTSLVESAAPGRYRYHDLVRLYARACAERDEQPPMERELALSRLLDFYLATAAGVYALERPGDRLVDHLEGTEHEGLSFTDHGQALDWLYTEATNLLACVRQVARPATLRRAVDLLHAALDLGESGANAKQYEAAAVTVREAARECGDPRAEARAAMSLANAHQLAGRFDHADREAEEAMRLAQTAQDLPAVGWAANARGIIALYRNRHQDGEAFLNQAIEAFRSDGNRPSEASALCNLSRIHLATGRTGSAISLARTGIEIYDSLGHALRGANGRYALGMALAQNEEFAAATARLTEALEIFRDRRQRLWEGMALFRLAEVEIASGQPAQAATRAEQALAVLRGIGGEWRRGNVLTILGRALQAVGQVDRARACWQEALEIFEELSSPEARQVRELIRVQEPSSIPSTA